MSITSCIEVLASGLNMAVAVFYSIEAVKFNQALMKRIADC